MSLTRIDERLSFRINAFNREILIAGRSFEIFVPQFRSILFHLTRCLSSTHAFLREDGNEPPRSNHPDSPWRPHLELLFTSSVLDVPRIKERKILTSNLESCC